MIPDMANPQHWNRFSYVLNNPFVYADPSGHKACELICKGDYVDWNEAKKGSAWEGEWNPKKQKENDKKAQAVIDTVYGVLDFVGSVVNEPYDWASTGSQCLNGHCSPLMLLGLLPLIPSSLGRHADDVYKAAVKNGDGAFAVLGRWMDNPKSYERIAGNLGATHLYSKRFNEIVEIYGAKAWWDKINAPFIQKEIIDKSKPVLLTTPFRVIVQNMTDSTLYKEVDMLLRAGYEPHGSILFPPVPKP